MARFRSSAAVGFAGSANVGAGGVVLPPIPNAPSPAVSRSSLVPSYVLVTTDPGTTKDGSVFSSEPDRHTATARNSRRVRFAKESLHCATLNHRRERADGGQCKKT